MVQPLTFIGVLFSYLCHVSALAPAANQNGTLKAEAAHFFMNLFSHAQKLYGDADSEAEATDDEQWTPALPKEGAIALSGSNEEVLLEPPLSKTTTLDPAIAAHSSEELFKMAADIEQRGLEKSLMKRKAERQTQLDKKKKARNEKREAKLVALQEKRDNDDRALAAYKAEQKAEKEAQELAMARKKMALDKKYAPIKLVLNKKSENLKTAMTSNTQVLQQKIKQRGEKMREAAARKMEEERAEAEIQAAEAAEMKATLEAKLDKVAKREQQRRAAQEKEIEIQKAIALKEQQKVNAQTEKLKEHAKSIKELDKQKKWAKEHYMLAEMGQDCSPGYVPVTSLTACKMAQTVLGGVDDLDLARAWGNRPGGCFLHATNDHVNFNPATGNLNNEDRRFCEKIFEAAKQLW